MSFVNEFLNPELSISLQTFFRVAYGFLLAGTLLLTLPQTRRFFLSERWGGYARSSVFVNLIQNPVLMPAVMAVWLAASVWIILGFESVWAALINLILCRYFFIQMRWRGGLRFNHVAKSLTLTCVFTTLKYYPSQPSLFRERLLRYSKTLPCPKGQVLVFEYHSILKRPARFEFVPVVEDVVDPEKQSVMERSLEPHFSAHAVHPLSPIHEGHRPGSYAPIRHQNA